MVASDGSGIPGALDPGVVLSFLHSQRLWLREHAGVGVARHAVTAADAAQLTAALRSLPPETAAIFLTRTEPERARAVQREFAAAGSVAVVTDHDATAIAVAAAVLITLKRIGVTPGESQVVIAGAQTLPVLPPLVMAAGVADLLSWNQADAIGFPLASVAREATAVIDLLGAAPTTLTPAFADTPVPVIAPDEVTALVAAAGLLRALAATRPRSFGADPYHDVNVYLACA